MKPINGYILVEPLPLKKRLITEYNVNNRDPYCINARCVEDSKYYKKGDIIQFKEALQRGVSANNLYFTGQELGLNPMNEYWLVEEEPSSIGGIFGYFPNKYVDYIKTGDDLHDKKDLLRNFIVMPGISIIELTENKINTSALKHRILANKLRAKITVKSGHSMNKGNHNLIEMESAMVFNRGGKIIKGNMQGATVFLDRYVGQLVLIGKKQYAVVCEKDIVATIV